MATKAKSDKGLKSMARVGEALVKIAEILEPIDADSRVRVLMAAAIIHNIPFDAPIQSKKFRLLPKSE